MAPQAIVQYEDIPDDLRQIGDDIVLAYKSYTRSRVLGAGIKLDDDNLHEAPMAGIKEVRQNHFSTHRKIHGACRLTCHYCRSSGDLHSVLPTSRRGILCSQFPRLIFPTHQNTRISEFRAASCLVTRRPPHAKPV